MFPLPTPDEMFSTLANGEPFSKFDPARAYKQIEVAENSQPFLMINTHLGLFCYRRLPFGITSAPAMWQKAMSVVLCIRYSVVGTVWVAGRVVQMQVHSGASGIPWSYHQQGRHSANQREWRASYLLQSQATRKN